MIVHSILTHHPPSVVDEMLGAFQQMAPEVVFVIGFGGEEEEFGQISFPSKIFLSDPSLRGTIEKQNFGSWLKAVAGWIAREHLEPTAVHFSENDHIPLRPDYWCELERALHRSGCDFLGKWCTDRTNTNEAFYLFYRDDERLMAHLRSLSGRTSGLSIWGALANGMLFRWSALQSLAAIDLELECFTEILVPSTLHHLGFSLGDMDAHSNLFQWVRHRPDFDLSTTIGLTAQDAFCCHPFKDVQSLPAIWKMLRACKEEPC